MNDTATISDLTHINASQHMDVMSDPSKTGKYYYMVEDDAVATPWVGIDKRGGDVQAKAFAEFARMSAWFDSRTNGQPAATAEPFDAEKEFLKGIDETPPSPAPAAAETSQSQPAETDGDEANPISTDELKALIEKEETEFFVKYRRAAVAESKLKALRQEFDQAYADLIAETKLATAERDGAAKALKMLARAYGKRTGEKQFDQYISFRENKVITWDEPEAIAWLGQNFPAALINPGVSIDATRFRSYISDCLKKKQPLPPSVKVDTEWETTISSKIPVPELEGGGK